MAEENEGEVKKKPGRPKRVVEEKLGEGIVLPKEDEAENDEEVKDTEPQKPIEVQKPPIIEEPKPPTIELSVEGANTFAHVYPQIRVGVCEFHGSPYGNVDMMTLKGRCSHVCANDPLCPHSRTGCPKIPKYDTIDGQQIQVGFEEYCRHEHNYKGLQMRCTYCPKDADMRRVIKDRTLHIYGSPDNQNKLIVVCSDYRCVEKHQKKYNNTVV
jgi:hypothetical protein